MTSKENFTVDDSESFNGYDMLGGAIADKEEPVKRR